VRRDRALAAARDEYKETIASIDRSARVLGGGELKATYKTLAEMAVRLQACEYRRGVDPRSVSLALKSGLLGTIRIGSTSYQNLTG
jgi:hypothetical protein